MSAAEKTSAPERVRTPAKHPANPAEAPEKRRKTRQRETVFGLVLLVLSVIGICTLVQRGMAFAAAHKNGAAEKAALTQCILPLTLADTPSFESPDALTDEQFLTAAVWAMIADGKLADYPADAGLCTVPASDVTAAGNARFGTVRQPEHRTVGFHELIRFYYDPDQQCYFLPVQTQYLGNLPEITACTAEQDVYRVKAVCRPDQPAWAGTEAPVVKQAEFVLKRSGGAWRILSMKTDAPDADENAASQALPDEASGGEQTNQ
ncbi:MAG: hypothetical protein K5705_02765 [Oscillospiraceae bacterium]|nr:hypothetical protein [Oscillospiraceae bacterium]